MTEQKLCRKCGQPFEPTAHQLRKRDYQCVPCRRQSDREWRQRRKAEGRPVISFRMPREYQAAYYKKYSQRPEVKARKARQARERRNNPAERFKHEARWQLNRAIASGRIQKQPCCVCGEPKSEGHHEDYSRPLDVQWLCRVHHREIHSKAEGKDQ